MNHLNKEPRLLSAAAVISLLAVTSSFAETFTWTGTTSGDWNDATNWSSDGANTRPNEIATGDVVINNTTNLDQIIRGNTTINSLEFGSSNLGETTIGLIAGNGTTARNLTFSATSGNSTLTIDAASTGDKIFNNLGKVRLNSNLDIVHNGADDLRFNSEVTSSGNLSITGSGVTYLDGANTYTGNTTINAGSTLRSTSGAGSEFAFKIGANGVNNAMLGTGSVFLHTTFVLDLSTASTIVGSEWLILDVDNLTESYRSTFAVASENGGFTEASGLWSITENGVDYEFAELTGMLTVVPEPGTYALLAGLTGLTYVMLRRRRA
ncbi:MULTISPECIES: PEP-CTERM sorting domain-containing protein [unclassified Lentimonas]|uniref:PEP-CTERM sorting domain-containing protein n=1 Tax=unclassified Lentimonas TaxID=2630993 RepID=UPI001321A51C|nr:MULTISPECIES: PEP-CTERM sorting domain-containing protein [unclassified Lentimonas]CAA6689499.1 Unannotated [Lentimonas sp. CC19]CAA6692515.1 Unannotated [Lentimonas sp. CC10]CAA7069154.1 Unannotated [Lentimonas sp. CC11]